MNSNPTGSGRTDCEKCPIRKLKTYRTFTGEELSFVQSFKTGELYADRGSQIFIEGANAAHLYTVLSGAVFRYKILDDGRRQILNYAMPGDLIGLQGSMMGEMQHAVEALTPVRLCVFERGRIDELYRKHPGLGYDITWIAAREERILDEHLLSIGRRSALERAAYLLAFLKRKAQDTGFDTGFEGGKSGDLPLTQHHVADTLGLSVVHTNKTLRKLAARGMVRWRERGCDILDLEGLLAIAGWDGESASKRPFI